MKLERINNYSTSNQSLSKTFHLKYLLFLHININKHEITQLLKAMYRMF